VTIVELCSIWYILGMEKEKKKERKPRELRREKRIAFRVSEDLYKSLADRAYNEQKLMSTVMTEALVKYLDFKAPPRN
jgi:hypothetical protein